MKNAKQIAAVLGMRGGAWLARPADSVRSADDCQSPALTEAERAMSRILRLDEFCGLVDHVPARH